MSNLRMEHLDFRSKDILSYFYENQEKSFSIKELLDGEIIDDKSELDLLIAVELIEPVSSWGFSSTPNYKISTKGIIFYKNGNRNLIPTQQISHNYHIGSALNSAIGNQISSASNLVVGNQQNVTVNITNIEQFQKEIEKCDDIDKPLLYELCELLKEIINNTKPIRKGMFSKFRDGIAKYSPLAIGLGQILVALLTKQ